MGEPLGQWTRTSAGGSGMSRTSRLIPKTWKGIGFMASSYHRRSRSSLRETPLHGLALDGLELGFEAREVAVGLLELLLGVTEMRAYLVEVVPDPVDVPSQPGQVVLDFEGVRLDTKPAQAEDDDLEVCVETVGRDGNDAPRQGVRRHG